MGRGIRWIERRLLPHGWADVARQLVLFTGAFAIYNLVRGLVASSNPYKPFSDAMRIIDFERAAHIFVEPSINAWAQSKHLLIDAADWIYLNGHFFVTIGVLIFIYLRRNDSFYFIRNVVMMSMALALVGYWLYPTAPPRMFGEWGFTDSVSQFMTGGTGFMDYGPAKAFTNFYAAVPSMHVCFALIIGLSMSRLVRRRWARIAWCAYPLLVTFVVVATANHYFTDVFLGGFTAGLSAVLAHRLLARARPEVWAFGHATA